MANEPTEQKAVMCGNCGDPAEVGRLCRDCADEIAAEVADAADWPF